MIIALADAGVPPEAEIEFWAGPRTARGRTAWPGNATRLHHDRGPVAQTEAGRLRLFGTRASCGARFAPRREPPLLRSIPTAFSSRVMASAVMARGISRCAARSLGRRDAIRRHRRKVLPTLCQKCRIPVVVFCLRRTRRRQDVPQCQGAGPLLRPQQRLHRGRVPRPRLEPFGDELQRLFDWMGRRSRKMPKEFDCVTMRPWDNYFWWLEVVRPAGEIDDLRRQPGRRLAALGRFPWIGKIGIANRISAKSQAGENTVWLGPEFVDFNKPITVELKGRRMTRPRRGNQTDDERALGRRPHPRRRAATSLLGESRISSRHGAAILPTGNCDNCGLRATEKIESCWGNALRLKYRFQTVFSLVFPSASTEWSQ